MQGDDALRLVAQTMRQHAGDLAERYGVGEFAFVSLGDKNTLPQLVENFRLAIQTLAVEHAAASSGILTVSAGVIVCNPQHNISSEQLLGTTDQLLYQAKAGGPNRVVQQVLE